MLDFLSIEVEQKQNSTIIVPSFKVKRSKDLMIKGSSFYAVWDEENQIWSTDKFRCLELIDNYVDEEAAKYKDGTHYIIRKKICNFSSKVILDFNKFLANSPDNYKTLNSKIAFSNTKIKKSDYISIRLPYPLEDCSIEGYDKMMSILYSDEEREKIEWAIGAILSGAGKEIQKFVVLYGEAGTGKSTVLNIVQKLFDRYCVTFDARALTSASNQFATEVFKNNPLVAIQHDGDLSKIEDNTKFNSIVSHEKMVINEKHKSLYEADTNCFLFIGTNTPVKITNAKSGLIRRLIDVQPTGNKLPEREYFRIMNNIDFELPGIAKHCMSVYEALGPDYYSSYKPITMMLQTDVFYNFVESNYFIFSEQDGTTLTQAYDMYKQFCSETLVDFVLPRHKFREELKSYFKTFEDMTRIDGKQTRSYYKGFKTDKFNKLQSTKKESIRNIIYRITLSEQESIFDKVCAECSAQYASTSTEAPKTKWEKVQTKLKDLDTSKTHYVKPPDNMIVIDFDLKDENNEKSFERNLEEASKWPSTYTETSKSGKGIHLHYFYDGDISELAPVYSPDIEIKTFKGNASLRRKLYLCNSEEIKHISSGLPKKENKMINYEGLKNEKALRTVIQGNLEKKYHPNTKPSIDYIAKALEDAYNSGMHYDVTDMRMKVLSFALGSTHQSEYCVKKVNEMKFASDDVSPNKDAEGPIVFYDVEVFPNLFLINWKIHGSGDKCVRMINPTPEEVDDFLHRGYRLVGFNCRRYDNHILYARAIGYSNEELFKLSQKIVNGSRNCMFGEAYNISYADVYDFASIKQSLKKWEIELGIHHKELGFKWDLPVPEEKWAEVAEYCDNDVNATEATFDARQEDFVAREILAELSGLTINDTTQMHTAKIIFGDDPKPQEKFVYTDLSTIFPGYKFDNGKSTYKGVEVGEGGRVYAEPGMYYNVPVLDIMSMHPHSLMALNLFGPYTKNFKELVDARIAIKHKDYEKAKTMLGGILAKYLDDESKAKALAYALKIVINIVYGLTSATFDSKFKDPRNKDNIVAKRGALFMVDLQEAVEAKGYKVAHIKTDSIKIPGADEKIINFVKDFGAKYGYTFELEDYYDRMCLVNDAVYIARYKDDHVGCKWTATGAQFAHPYVFKKLFSKEEIIFEDLCETKSVSTALYLDMNESLPEGEHDYVFVGKVGLFVPIKLGCGGGILCREAGEGKFNSAVGAKDYRWLEAEVVKLLGKEKDIDMRYYDNLAEKAKETINKFGDFDIFVDETPLPWEE